MGKRNIIVQIIIVAFCTLLINIYSSFSVIFVPENYSKIQEAILYADQGELIIVNEGIYYENIDIERPVVLKCRKSHTCIIRAKDPNDHVFDIKANYVWIDGFKIEGPGHHNPDGISLHANYVKITNNIISNSRNGIFLGDSNFNFIANNTIFKNFEGILLSRSSKNTLINNRIFNNRFGVTLWGSGNNFLENNSIFGNKRNFGVWGDYIQNISITNKINDKPIYYLINKKNIKLSGEIGFLALINCKNVTVRNTILKDNDQGILLVNTRDSKIENVTIIHVVHGIYLLNSHENLLRNCTIFRGTIGIVLENSDNNYIENNKITDFLATGILFDNSNNNILTRSLLLNNRQAIRLSFSTNNTLFLNNIINNTEDVEIENSYGNLWNSPRKLTYIYKNITHEGYLGNYWDRYKGKDVEGDGIGDSPFKIDKDFDNFPLIEPFENYRILHEKSKENYFVILTASLATLLIILFFKVRKRKGFVYSYLIFLSLIPLYILAIHFLRANTSSQISLKPARVMAEERFIDICDNLEWIVQNIVKANEYSRYSLLKETLLNFSNFVDENFSESVNLNPRGIIIDYGLNDNNTTSGIAFVRDPLINMRFLETHTFFPNNSLIIPTDEKQTNLTAVPQVICYALNLSVPVYVAFEKNTSRIVIDTTYGENTVYHNKIYLISPNDANTTQISLILQNASSANVAIHNSTVNFFLRNIKVIENLPDYCSEEALLNLSTFIKVPSLSIEFLPRIAKVNVSQTVKIEGFILNTGNINLTNVYLSVEAPTGWLTNLTPTHIPLLSDMQNFTLEITPTYSGNFTVNITADSGVTSDKEDVLFIVSG